MKSLNESIAVKLGPKTFIDDFKDLGIDESPTFEKYEVEDHDGHMPDPPEELVATPEVVGSYVKAEVMLPRGDHLARGKVVSCKHAADGNTIGLANNSPILDTHQYEVQFC
jgi:hypothetical protein